MNNWEEFYYIFKYTIYVLYFLSFFKLWDESKTYLDIFNYFWQIILGLILIILYNPLFYIKSGIRNDAVFSAGFLLIANSNLLLIQNYGTQIWDFISSKFSKVSNS